MPTLDPVKPIPKNISKEWVSLAFVRALCAQAGLNITQAWEWDDGLDLTIGCAKAGFAGVRVRNISYHLQVKSTADWRITNGRISYRFKEVEKYNELIQESAAPQHLVVYTLPPVRWQWVQSYGTCAVFNHCAYFLSFAGEKLVKDGSASKTIQIPTSNRLTAGELIRMYRDAYATWRSR